MKYLWAFILVGFVCVVESDVSGQSLDDAITNPYDYVLATLEERICGVPCKQRGMLRAQIDLNNDNLQDLIAFPEAGRGNGGGPFFVFLKAGDHFKLIGDSASQPWCLEVLEEVDHNTKQLRGYFRHEGVSSFQFDGWQYQEKHVEIPGYQCRTNLSFEKTSDLINWSNNDFANSFNREKLDNLSVEPQIRNTDTRR